MDDGCDDNAVNDGMPVLLDNDDITDCTLICCLMGVIDFVLLLIVLANDVKAGVRYD